MTTPDRVPLKRSTVHNPLFFSEMLEFSFLKLSWPGESGEDEGQAGVDNNVFSIFTTAVMGWYRAQAENWETRDWLLTGVSSDLR